MRSPRPNAPNIVLATNISAIDLPLPLFPTSQDELSFPRTHPYSAIFTSTPRFAIRTANAIPVTVTHSGIMPAIDRLGFLVVAGIAGLPIVCINLLVR